MLFRSTGDHRERALMTLCLTEQIRHKWQAHLNHRREREREGEKEREKKRDREGERVRPN